MKYTLILGILFIGVLGGGYWYFTTQSIAPVVSTTTDGTYTAAEVAAHRTAQDCWTSINGGVYDVTEWIRNHPGGEGPILSLCGQDGTAAFMGQHGSDSRPQRALAGFKIGTLVP